MKIAIFSKATRSTRSGNWVTASRWKALLQSAGHDVSILHHEGEIKSGVADLLIGLHARRSGKAVQIFKQKNPNGQTIVALTGTDIYRDLSLSNRRRKAAAVETLNVCDRIVLLQPLMAKRLKTSWRAKSSVVVMDAAKVKAVPNRKRIRSRKRKQKHDAVLHACVVGHLRFEKDPMRAAMAVRKLPCDVSVNVTHVGKALSDSFQLRADRELQQNENWNWLGSVTHAKVQQLMRTSDILINSSRAEGAPNVLFEAISWRLPVIASKIDGHVGVLGKDYRGYFEVGDTRALRELLIRSATDQSYYQGLVLSIDTLAKKYRAGNERKALLNAIQLTSQ